MVFILFYHYFSCLSVIIKHKIKKFDKLVVCNKRKSMVIELKEYKKRVVKPSQHQTTTDVVYFDVEQKKKKLKEAKRRVCEAAEKLNW